MRFDWQIEPADIESLLMLRRQQKRRPFVQRRIARNVKARSRIRISNERIWLVHLGCLLTTQQRSGPGSSVQRFLDARPFPLPLGRCREVRNVSRLIESELRRFGGIRWAPKTAEYASYNLQWLENGGWRELQKWIRRLMANGRRTVERAAARYVSEQLKGFGPKQARNFWQWLGLTRFEIPIDSRVIAWLNTFGFPVKLSAAGLSDPDYYEFVLDAIQKLCREARLYPCVFDALVFASYDGKDWIRRSRTW